MFPDVNASFDLGGHRVACGGEPIWISYCYRLRKGLVHELD